MYISRLLSNTERYFRVCLEFNYIINELNIAEKIRCTAYSIDILISYWQQKV